MSVPLALEVLNKCPSAIADRSSRVSFGHPVLSFRVISRRRMAAESKVCSVGQVDHHVPKWGMAFSSFALRNKKDAKTKGGRTTLHQ